MSTPVVKYDPKTHYLGEDAPQSNVVYNYIEITHHPLPPGPSSVSFNRRGKTLTVDAYSGCVLSLYSTDNGIDNFVIRGDKISEVNFPGHNFSVTFDRCTSLRNISLTGYCREANFLGMKVNELTLGGGTRLCFDSCEIGTIKLSSVELCNPTIKNTTVGMIQFRR